MFVLYEPCARTYNAWPATSRLDQQSSSRGYSGLVPSLGDSTDSLGVPPPQESRGLLRPRFMRPFDMRGYYKDPRYGCFHLIPQMIKTTGKDTLCILFF